MTGLDGDDHEGTHTPTTATTTKTPSPLYESLLWINLGNPFVEDDDDYDEDSYNETADEESHENSLWWPAVRYDNLSALNADLPPQYERDGKGVRSESYYMKLKGQIFLSRATALEWDDDDDDSEESEPECIAFLLGTHGAPPPNALENSSRKFVHSLTPQSATKSLVDHFDTLLKQDNKLFKHYGVSEVWKPRLRDAVQEAMRRLEYAMAQAGSPTPPRAAQQSPNASYKRGPYKKKDKKKQGKMPARKTSKAKYKTQQKPRVTSKKFSNSKQTVDLSMSPAAVTTTDAQSVLSTPQKKKKGRPPLSAEQKKQRQQQKAMAMTTSTVITAGTTNTTKRKRGRPYGKAAKGAKAALNTPSPMSTISSASSRLVVTGDVKKDLEANIKKNDAWKSVYEIFKKFGWTHKTGGGLISYKYIPPAELELDVPYFTEELQVKLYAMEAFGWGGDTETDEYQLQNGESRRLSVDFGKNTRGKRKQEAVVMDNEEDEAAEDEQDEDEEEDHHSSFSDSAYHQHKDVPESTVNTSTDPPHSPSNESVVSTSTTSSLLEPVIPFSKALSILTNKFKFRYQNNRYILPSTYDENGADLQQEGVHAFSRPEEVRAALCRHGIPLKDSLVKKHAPALLEGASSRRRSRGGPSITDVVDGILKNEERYELERWLAMTHVQDHGQDLASVCPNPMNVLQAYKILKRIGFLYSNSCYYLTPWYSFLVDKGDQPVEGRDFFKDAEELRGFLCRHGLKNCVESGVWQGLEMQQRVDLSFWVCEVPHKFPFYRATSIPQKEFDFCPASMIEAMRSEMKDSERMVDNANNEPSTPVESLEGREESVPSSGSSNEDEEEEPQEAEQSMPLQTQPDLNPHAHEGVGENHGKFVPESPSMLTTTTFLKDQAEEHEQDNVVEDADVDATDAHADVNQDCLSMNAKRTNLKEHFQEEASLEQENKNDHDFDVREQEKDDCGDSTSTPQETPVITTSTETPDPREPHDEDMLTPASKRAIANMKSIKSPVQKDDSWQNVIYKLEYTGWERKKGSNLVEYYYVLPGCSLKDGVRGVDYFDDEYEVKLFVEKHFGWGGDKKWLQEKTSRQRVRKRSRTSGRGVQMDRQTEVAETVVRVSPASLSKRDAMTEISQKRKKAKMTSARGSPEESAKTVVSEACSEIKPQENTTPPSTVQDVLLQSQSALQSTASLNNPSYWMKHEAVNGTSTNQVMKAVNATREFLFGLVKRWMAEDRECLNKASVYLHGKPGTGKTTAVEQSLVEAKELAKQTQSTTASIPVFMFVNVAHVCCTNDATPSSNSSTKGTSNHVAAQVVSAIAKNMGMSGGSSLTQIEARLNLPSDNMGQMQSKTRMVVLAMDEIDLLLGNNTGGKGGQVLYTLLRWASDPNCAFALVGISNCAQNQIQTKLPLLGTPDHGAVPRPIVFPPYNPEQLKSIIRLRVPQDYIFADSALDLICRKVAAVSGDVRRAMELTTKAISCCMSTLSEENLLAIAPTSENSAPLYPLVKMKHAFKVVKQIMGITLEKEIQSLPAAAKVALCVALTLSKHIPDCAIVDFRLLKGCCKRATEHGLLDQLSDGDFLDIVQMLSDAGLLMVGDDLLGRDFEGQSFVDLKHVPLRIGVQLEEVECALEKMIEAEPFYSELVHQVKKKFFS